MIRDHGYRFHVDKWEWVYDSAPCFLLHPFILLAPYFKQWYSFNSKKGANGITEYAPGMWGWGEFSTNNISLSMLSLFSTRGRSSDYVQ